MKVLKGRLTEKLYGWPCENASNASSCAKSADASSGSSTEHTCNPKSRRGSLSIKRVTNYEQDQVTYMNDRLGLHRIENPDPTEIAISLHLYTVSRMLRILRPQTYDSIC